MKMPNSLTLTFMLVCAAAAVLMLCLLTFFTLSAGTESLTLEKFAASFLLNLPFCIAIALLDIGITNYTSRFNRLSPLTKLTVDFVATAVVIAALSIAANELLAAEKSVDFVQRIMPALLLGAVILLCVELYQLGEKRSADSKRLLEIEKEKAKYQYQALKNQINPHFLFNCLNVIASLAYEDPDKTNLFTKRLSNVYRYLLSTHSKNAVTVADELRFTREYIFLQQIRFEDNLKISIIKSGDCDGRLIVPASVQMSVENAIKHNVCNSANPLEITVEANSDLITVRNRLNRIHDSAATGTGIANLREQFRVHGAEITITETETEFTVRLPYLPK